MPALTLETSEDALVALIKTAVDAFTPGTGFVAPLMQFVDAPSDPDAPNPPAPSNVALLKQPFIRFVFGAVARPRTGIKGSPGGGRFERAGVARCDVFTPKGYGKLENSRICTAIEDVIDADYTSGLRFEEVRTREIGSDDIFFHQVVLVDWFYVEHK